MVYWADLDVASLQQLLADRGHKPSHARLLLRAFYASGGATTFEDVPVGDALRDTLRGELSPYRSSVVARTVAGDGTTKLLLGFPDGAAVETVLMPDYRPERAWACVSSQVGCAMGCDFCATAVAGLHRNLEAGEIVEQFLHIRTDAARIGRRVTSVVFMGMGEPMHNLDNVIAAVRRIADPDLGAVGWRQVTISTVGIVPGIDRLAEADLNLHLAVSLHAADDETRERIVPPNRRYPVTDVMAAAKRFYTKTGRIVTIECCLLDGVNDSDAHARRLAELVAGFRAHVNLIPYNPIGTGLSGATYRRPPDERVSRFLQILRSAGVVTHIRRPRGDDRDAACGQLRRTKATLPMLPA